MEKILEKPGKIREICQSKNWEPWSYSKLSNVVGFLDAHSDILHPSPMFTFTVQRGLGSSQYEAVVSIFGQELLKSLKEIEEVEN